MRAARYRTDGFDLLGVLRYVDLLATTNIGREPDPRCSLRVRAWMIRNPRPDRGRSAPRHPPGAPAAACARCAAGTECPRPWPSCAPSISPGMSATTKLRSSFSRDYAQVRLERRERIVRDLRPRRRDPRNQCGFAGVREAHQTDVRQKLQFQPQIALFTRTCRASCSVGAWCVEVAKRAFPRPPRPPFATESAAPIR